MDQNNSNMWDEKQVQLKEVVLSNSWAMQAILMYLEEQNPGARNRIWQLYQTLKSEAEAYQNSETDESQNPQ